ncbi:MAG: hypothetical protein ACTSRD_12955 [Promethearchaeota archaeon]
MANNKGAVIVLAILAIAGLGLSGYMFVNDTFLGGNEFEHEHQTLKLVALWNHLTENTENNPLHSLDYNFLIEYQEAMVIDTNYVNVINETRFTLSTAGLYKVNLNVMYEYIDPGATYWTVLLQNNTEFEYLDYFITPTPVYDNTHFTTISFYINSTGDDSYYEFNARCNGVLHFEIYSSSDYNQLSIEYLIQE